mgnify:CR=1 FL=1
MTPEAVLQEIIEGQKVMTLAMCQGDEPYLATLSYAYDADANCFYFHCAPEGKKLDYLRANPNVWGQVVENRGYVTGKCDHAYRSVHFAGQVDFLEDEEEKRAALTLMIRQMEPDPGPLEQRLLARARLGKTVVGRVRVQVRGAALGMRAGDVRDGRVRCDQQIQIAQHGGCVHERARRFVQVSAQRHDLQRPGQGV